MTIISSLLKSPLIRGILTPLIKKLIINPSLVSGLVCDNDITTETAQASLVIWTDRSGNGNSPTNTAGNERPFVLSDVNPNSFNGVRGVLFDGNDDSLIYPSSGFLDLPNTIFIVAKFLNNSTDQYLLARQEGGINGGVLAARKVGGNMQNEVIDAASPFADANIAAVPANGVPFILTSKAIAGGKAELALNNNVFVASAETITGFLNAAQVARVGKRPDSGTSFFNGIYGRVLVYNRQLPLATSAGIINFLKRQFNFN